MFWVINKDKVYSYAVTLSVIGVLFVMSAVIPKEKLVETSARVENEIVNNVNTNSVESKAENKLNLINEKN